MAFIKTLKHQRTMGKTKESVYSLKKAGKNKYIEVNEIKGVLQNIEKLNIPNSKIMIRGINALSQWTLKGYQTPLNIDTYDDYFNGKVSDVSKFENFYQLEVTVSRLI